MNQRLSWDLIASARAVLNTGSLSAAARSLGVTQPTIRRHVDALETLLGLTLFTRSPTGLIPTQAARDIAPYAEDINGLIAAISRGVSADRDRIGGTIRLACSEIMGSEVLPFLLEPFLASYPDLAIELVSSNYADNLLRRDADLAVRMMRPVQDGLVGKRVASIQVGFFAADVYIDRHGAPTDLADLIARHALVGEDKSTTIIDALATLTPGAASAKFRYRSDSDTAQLAAIRAGVGIGICQMPLSFADPRLVRVLPVHATTMEVWLVAHEDLRNQLRIRTLMDYLSDALARYATVGIRPDNGQFVPEPT